MNTITIDNLNQLKSQQQKISCLTAYDASFAKIIDNAKIDIILIGDSLGTVIQGQPSTVPVKVDDIIYHSQAVARVCNHSLLIADMPFLSCATIEMAINNAGKILQTTGVHMVKIEGKHYDIIKALSQQGIAVCGHLGLLPQAVNQVGKYQVQGKDSQAAQQILEDALELQAAGAKLIVLECIPTQLAKKITEQLTIPTIGIGAGLDCDGQVLVLYDMLGISINKVPKFAKNFLADASSIPQAIAEFDQAVKLGKFPTDSHSFNANY